MSERKQSGTCTTPNTTTTISDLRTSHVRLAPNEYSSAAIGVHSCLVRCCEHENLAKFFYQGITMGSQKEDFMSHLNDIEKSLSTKCQLDIERSAIIARLRKYLNQNEGLLQNMLTQIHQHLQQCMREDHALSHPKTMNELIQQCNQRHTAALQLHQAHRMRRFQFYDDNESKQTMNAINLQNWIFTHFQLFTNNITPDSPYREQLILHLKTLLDNSFCIIEQPSPAIVTHSSGTKEPVTAKVKCRVLCLLDKSSPAITIDKIQPYVCCVAALNPPKKADIFYQQEEIDWKTDSIVTASNHQRSFSFADLSSIILGQQNIVSKGKIHYAPFLYRIDFHINITVRFSKDPTPYQHCVIIQSAPFGVITHASQGTDLFAKVFIEDLKSWSSPLTMDALVDGIRRYFIHKTGIHPKDWVMPYIETELRAACNNPTNSAENLFHVLLVKILAQINYMAEHPLLIFFHYDGLFLAICDSDTVRTSLLEEHHLHQASICAIRFGTMSRMVDPEKIGVRIEVAEKSFPDTQRYKFDTDKKDKFSNELGLYIIKIKLCQASQFDQILTSLNPNANNEAYIPNTLENLSTIVDFYHSEKLEIICPHKEKYSSIWQDFRIKENNQLNGSNPSTTSDQSSNYTTTTEMNADNLPYNLWDSQDCPIHQTPQQYYQQIPLQQYQPQFQAPPSSQTQFYPTNPNVPQYPIAPPITSTPIIIVVTNPTNSPLPTENILQMISHNLPEYSPLLQSSRIHYFHLDQRSIPNLPN